MGPEYSDAKRKLLEKYLQGEFGLRPEAQRIGARPPGERIPLSHAQEQVWVHAQLAPELPLYNEPVTIHYSGRLDVSALQRSFNEILRRHEDPELAVLVKVLHVHVDHVGRIHRIA